MKELNCASSFLSAAMASVQRSMSQAQRSMLAGSRAKRSKGLRVYLHTEVPDQQESRTGLSMTYLCLDWMADPRSGQSIILYCI
jgi:hypothetical protein